MATEADRHGLFWTPTSPEAQVRGLLSLRTGEDPEVTLDAGLVEDPRIHRVPGGIAFTGSAEASVASFLPITLHGRLDDGECVTILMARNHGGDGQYFGIPRYVGESAVLGGHLDVDQPISAVRFRIGHRYWLDHLKIEDTAVNRDGAQFSVDASENGNWLVYSPPAPATLRHLQVVAVSGTRTLLQLALDQQLDAHDIQVRTEPAAPWMPLQDDELHCSATTLKPDALLPRDVLTIERIANWIALNDRLDGLAAAVTTPMNVALQAETLVLTSLVEGIHRRLPYEQSKFSGMPPETRKAILNAARNAARLEADQHGVGSQTVSESVQFLTEVSFRTRATEIVHDACNAIPEITESVADLPGLITKARNDFAHHLRLDREKEPLERSYLRWLIAVTATPWLLRAVLLQHAGVPIDAVRHGFLESSRFDHARANIAQFVRELGWEPNSENEPPG